MAKKKSVRKLVRKNKKILARKSPAKAKRIKKEAPKKFARYNKKKFDLVLKNLIFFVILFIVSLALYNVSGKGFENLFFLLSLIFGFVSVAFLIVLLIFLILKGMKK